MGQTKHSKNRNRGSSSGYFLSPSRGASSVPIASGLTHFLPYAVGVFGLAFLASCITASIMTPVQNSDATTQVDIKSNQVAYFVNIATAGNTIEKNIQATYAGTLGIIPDTLTVTSNTPDGYKVYLSMANDDPAASKQRLVNTSDPSVYFNPISSGSLSAPANLGTPNTWGVAVASTYNSAFDAATSYTDATISQTTKFAPVPAKGEEELLITRTGSTVTQDGSGQTDTIPVYYGYHANSALPSGTYSNTVMYTAYAEASDAERKTAIVAPSKVDSYKDNTQRLSFTTTLYTNREITPSQVSVKINDLDCTDVQMGSAGAGNDSVVFSCKAPAQTRPGTYDAVVSIPDYGHVSYASVDYDTPGITATVAGVETTITEMQEMTADICEAWDDGLRGTNYWNSADDKPKAFTTTEQKPIYTYGNGIIEDDIVRAASLGGGIIDDTTWSYTSDARITNLNSITPESYLYDNRDDNLYHIRKLADGNCWMTDSLRLILDNEVALTNVNTNLVTKTSWTPQNSTEPLNGTTSWIITGNETIEAEIINKGISSENADNYRALYHDHSVYSGNHVYYNFTAATAGVVKWDNITTLESICPKNWQLPRYGFPGNNTPGWGTLVIDTYGGGTYNESSNPMGSANGSSWTGQGHYKKVSGAHIKAVLKSLAYNEPVNFMYGGQYNYKNNSMSNLDGASHYWTLNTYGTGQSFQYYGDTLTLYVSATTDRGNGNQIRCVAQ